MFINVMIGLVIAIMMALLLWFALYVSDGPEVYPTETPEYSDPRIPVYNPQKTIDWRTLQ